MIKKKLIELKDWTKTNLKRRKSIIIIFVVYLILFALYYYFFLYKPQWASTKAFFNNIEPGFAVSFSASLLEDLIIFIALSFLVLALTTKDLFDYSFAEKLTAIINSEDSDNLGLNEYLQTKVARLLAYDKLIQVVMTVTDYNEDQQAYKIFIETIFTIKNMCRDREFKLEEDYNFYVYKSDIAINNEYGEVTLFTTQRSTDRQPRIYVDETKAFKLTEKFKQPVDLTISKDKSLKVHIKYHTWSKTGNNFETDKNKVTLCNLIKSDRYVEKMSIVIKNQMDSAFKYEISLNDKQKSNFKIIPLEDKGIRHPGNEKAIVIDDGLFPQDEVLVYIQK